MLWICGRDFLVHFPNSQITLQNGLYSNEKNTEGLIMLHTSHFKECPPDIICHIFEFLPLPFLVKTIALISKVW